MKCPICGGKTRDQSHPSNFDTYHRCQDCGFIFLDPTDRISPQEEKARYDMHKNSIRDEDYVAFLRRFLDEAVFPFLKTEYKEAESFQKSENTQKSQCPQRSKNFGRKENLEDEQKREKPKILDYGSGPQPVLAQILKRDYKLKANIYDLYYAPDKKALAEEYDLVICTEVVEHISEPFPVWEELSSLLKPGGLLAIMTLLVPDDLSNFWGWHYIRDYTHVSFYTMDSLQHITKNTGLSLIYTDAYRYFTFQKK